MLADSSAGQGENRDLLSDSFDGHGIPKYLLTGQMSLITESLGAYPSDQCIRRMLVQSVAGKVAENGKALEIQLQSMYTHIDQDADGVDADTDKLIIALMYIGLNALGDVVAEVLPMVRSLQQQKFDGGVVAKDLIESIYYAKVDKKRLADLGVYDLLQANAEWCQQVYLMPHQQWQELLIRSHAEVPGFFLCPISSQLIKNPVITEHGTICDESNLTQWFDSQGQLQLPPTDPITRGAIENDYQACPHIQTAIATYLSRYFEDIEAIKATYDVQLALSAENRLPDIQMASLIAQLDGSISQFTEHSDALGDELRDNCGKMIKTIAADAYKKKDYRRAEMYFRCYVGLFPANVTATKNMMMCCLYQNAYQQVIDFYNDCAGQVDNEIIDAHFHAANAYLHLSVNNRIRAEISIDTALIALDQTGPKKYKNRYQGLQRLIMASRNADNAHALDQMVENSGPLADQFRMFCTPEISAEDLQTLQHFASFNPDHTAVTAATDSAPAATLGGSAL